VSGFEQFLDTISGYVWGVPLLAVLFGTHLYLTFRLGFIQKHTFSAIRMSLTRTREGEGEITHFGALVVAGCIVLLVLRSETLPDTLQLIISSAFNGQAALGGFAGAGVKEAMRYGIARGLFSNESGLGSAPIVAAAAQTSHPVRQALISATGTFWDTVVLCAVTGIVVVNSGMWQEGLKGAELTNAAFNEVPHVGNVVLTFGLLTFVFSTILGWSYYGEKAMEYLFGKSFVVPYLCRYRQCAYGFTEPRIASYIESDSCC